MNFLSNTDLGITASSLEQVPENARKARNVARYWIRRGVENLKDFLKKIEVSHTDFWATAYKDGLQAEANQNAINIRSELTAKQEFAQAFINVHHIVEIAQKNMGGRTISDPDLNVIMGLEMSKSRGNTMRTDIMKKVLGVPRFELGSKNRKISKNSIRGRINAIKGLNFNEWRDFMFYNHIPERNARYEKMHEEERVAEMDGMIEEFDEKLSGLIGQTVDPLTTSEAALNEMMKDLPEEDASAKKRIIKKAKAIKEINKKEVSKMASGTSTQDANAWLDKLTDFQKKQYLDFYKEYKKEVLDHYLDYMARPEVGMITQEVADGMKNGLREGYPNYEVYVPMNVDPSLLPDKVNINMGPLSSQLYAAKGTGEVFGKDQRIDPMAMGLIKAGNAFRQGEVNAAIIRFKSLMLENPVPSQYAIIPARYIIKTNDNGDVIHFNNGVSKAITENSIAVKDGGKLYYLFFKPLRNKKGKLQRNPIVESLNRKPEMAGPVLRFVQKYIRPITGLMSSIFTTYSPDFVIPNIARDSQEANANIEAYRKLFNLKHIRWEAVKLMAKSTVGQLFSKATSKEIVELAREMEIEGVPMSWDFMQGTTEEVEIINKYIKDVERSARDPKVALKGGLEILSFVGNRIEMMPRIAAYGAVKKDLMKQGVPEKKAKQIGAYVAKNITLNFEKGGTHSAWLRGLYMFSQVGITSATASLRSVKSRRGKNVLAGAFALSLLNRMLLDANMDDEDYDRYIHNSFAATNNTLIFNPFDPANPWTLPKPWSLLRVAQNSAESIYDVAKGNKHPLEAAMDIAGALVTVFDPIGGTASFTAFVPTVFKPFAEAYINMAWNTGEISYVFNDPAVPNVMEYASATSDDAVWFAAQIYRLTGKAIDVSPDYYEYIAHQYYAGGPEIYLHDFPKALKNIKDAIVAQDFNAIDTHELPVFRRFYKRISQRERYIVYDLWKYANYTTLRSDLVTDEERKYMVRELATAKKNLTPRSFKRLTGILFDRYFSEQKNTYKDVKLFNEYKRFKQGR